MTAEERKNIAYGYMTEGYNCCQSTVMAFKDYFNMSEEDLLKLTSTLGGGVGQMRSVCGAVSGMALVLGAVFGYEGTDRDTKQALNKRVQELGGEFKKMNGSRSCFELTGLGPDCSTPKTRNDGRNCKDFVADFAKLIAEYIEANK